VLFLKPSAQRVFFPFLAEHFPERLKQYESNYAADGYLHGRYPARIREMVERIRARVGIGARELEHAAIPAIEESQMYLF
jgi:hypothetical protein